MSYLKNTALLGAIGAAIAFTPIAGVSSAQAAPVATSMAMAPGAAMQDLKGGFHKAGWNDRRRYRDRDRNWRRRHWRRHRDRYDDDWNPGAFIALGVLGALLNQGHSESYARSAMQRCDDRFRSFEWDTGLYTTYGGDKRLCPYLR
jgi:hypothetical protein